MKRVLVYVSVSLMSVMLVFPTAASAAPGRVSLTPATSTMTEGQSQVVTVELDEPIICETMDETCVVTLPLVVSDPSRATLSVNQITFALNEWASPKTFTLTALNDQVANTNNTITISALASSNSEYYSDYLASMSVTLTDLGAAPKPTAGFGDANSQGLSVAAGKTITLSGAGYKPNSEVTVTMYSAPQVLGTVLASSSGAFSGTFTVPRSSSIGAHELVVSGFDAGGVASSATLSLNVLGLADSGSHSQYLAFVALSFLAIGTALSFSARTRRRALLR